MYRHMTRIIPLLAILLGLGLQNVSAHEYRKGDLTFVHAHAYATIGAARAGAVFVTIRNDAAEADAFVAATRCNCDPAVLSLEDI